MRRAEFGIPNREALAMRHTMSLLSKPELIERLQTEHTGPPPLELVMMTVKALRRVPPKRPPALANKPKLPALRSCVSITTASSTTTATANSHVPRTESEASSMSLATTSGTIRTISETSASSSAQQPPPPRHQLRPKEPMFRANLNSLSKRDVELCGQLHKRARTNNARNVWEDNDSSDNEDKS
eukprot:c20464_g1_i1.p1 GENE.c20464_g1_i1~~c20464_g1_i1.p1  ORF type:complete len:185 (+),score=27.64 c20464_g1_i1:34-588(+)